MPFGKLGDGFGSTGGSGGTSCVNCVGLTMPSAFCVNNSPLTCSGTICVTACGNAAQYIRGDGTLQNFPEINGGVGGIPYYFNGSVNQGTFGGNTSYQISNIANTGAASNFSLTGNGLIAQFITDSTQPNVTSIPAGNWVFDLYLSNTLASGSPQVYAQIYKYSGSTLTLLSTSPNVTITELTTVTNYSFEAVVPLTTLLSTDRIVIQVYAANAGSSTTTLYTQNTYLSTVLTTFNAGISSLNGLTCNIQTFAVGTAGTSFNICSLSSTHTFNIPYANATCCGFLLSCDWTNFNNKGSVCSVCAVGCNGITVTGSPITTSGTLNICNTAPYTGQAVEVLASGTCSTYRCCVANIASGNYSASLSGCCNTSSSAYSVVVGGSNNFACGGCYNSVSGGFSNIAAGCYSVITGGLCNLSCGVASTVNAGTCNTSAGSNSSVAGGCLNSSSGCNSFVGGGQFNTSTGCNSAIAGGCCNVSIGSFSSIIGGFCNTVCGSALYGAIAGGQLNTVTSAISFIGGGCNNCSTGAGSTITGGQSNINSGGCSFVGSGCANCTTQFLSVVVAGGNNKAIAPYTTIVAGKSNTSSGSYGSIVAGVCNCTSGSASFIGAGCCNLASGANSFIGAGQFNTASGIRSSIVAGGNNCVQGLGGFIGVGVCNIICNSTASCCAIGSTIVNGVGNNTCGGVWSLPLTCFTTPPTILPTSVFTFIGTGFQNTISGCYSAIVTGYCNNVSGCYSTISGGYKNTICGNHSWAMGSQNTVIGGCSGAIGYGLNATASCTLYVNNLCACTNIYDASIASGCAVCATTNGQLIGYTPPAGCTGTVTSVCVGGSNVNITGTNPITTSGTVCVSIPQSVCTSACPQFAGACLTSTLNGTIDCMSCCVSSPILCGTTCVASPIVCGTTCVITPISCASTCVVSPIVCGTTCVITPIGCASNCIVYNNLLRTTTSLSFTPANYYVGLASCVNCYNQLVTQNLCAGTAASNDIIVNNNCSTDTTYYGDFGMNSSAFTGSGALNAPNMVYLTSTSGDLALGSTTANPIHFVINSGSSDAATIKTTCQLQLPAYSSTSAFTGTAIGYLAYDASGNVLTCGLTPSSQIITLGSGTCSTLRCGVGNGASGNYSSSLSGCYNNAAQPFASIVGGLCNTANGSFTFIGNGICNYITNSASSCCATGAVVVGGIGNNTCGGTFSLASCCFTVAPTICNAGIYSFIGGGFQNSATGSGSAVLGGCANTASGAYSGAFGCGLNACNACTFYSNNLFSCNTTTTCQVGAFSGTLNTNFASSCICFPNAASFNAGAVVSTGLNYSTNVYCGSITVPNYALYGATTTIDQHCFATAGQSVTFTQSVTPNAIRTSSSIYSLKQYNGTNSGTISHASSIQSLGWYNNGATAGCVLTVCNNYGLLINDQNGYSNSSSICLCNRWGVYQEGALDINFFCAAIKQSTVPSSCAVCINAGGCLVGYTPVASSGIIVVDTGTNSSVRCGASNCASGSCSSVLGGQSNLANGLNSFIGSGNCNNVCNNTSGCLAYGAVVVGGVGNNTTGGTWTLASCCFTVAPTICNAGSISFVGGGFQNVATGNCSSIVGGYINKSTSRYTFIGGGFCNTSSGYYAVVGGGNLNCATGNGASTVSGGQGNKATGNSSVVSGGANNLASGTGSAILGGQTNTASSLYSVVVSGYRNTSQAIEGFIGGGNCNQVCNSTSGCLAYGAVVVGGVGNNTTGGTWTLASCCFTVAPTKCNAGIYSFIGGGFQNSATGSGSAVLGGCANTASGAYSGAFGCNLIASATCTFYVNNLCSCGIGSFSNSVTASSIIKSGGTSSQFLKADGSIDSNTYLTTSSASSTYVPYTGATGAVNLNVQNLINTGDIYQNSTTSSFTTANRGVINANGSSTSLFGLSIAGVGKGFLFHDGTNLSLISSNSGSTIIFGANNTNYAILNASGAFTLGSTSGTGTGAFYAGAATFSSSVNSASSALQINPTNGYNVLIGTPTDAGYKLQVNGTASVSQIITGQTFLNASTFNQSFTISQTNGAGTTILSNNSTNYTWTLEPATGNNRLYILRTIGSNTITINTSGSDVIINNAGTSVSSLTMTSSTGAIILQSDGSSRWIQIK